MYFLTSIQLRKVLNHNLQKKICFIPDEIAKCPLIAKIVSELHLLLDILKQLHITSDTSDTSLITLSDDKLCQLLLHLNRLAIILDTNYDALLKTEANADSPSNTQLRL